MVFGLIGCGGSGAAAPKASPFVGSWSGTYSSPGQSGTGMVTIAADGSFIGSGFDNTGNANYSVKGAITNAGVVSGSLTEGPSTVGLQGTWAITNGHLGGAVTIVQNGVNGATNTYDMTKTG